MFLRSVVNFLHFSLVILFVRAKLCQFSNEAAQKCQDFEKQVSKNRVEKASQVRFLRPPLGTEPLGDCVRKRGRRVYESLLVEEQNELETAIDHTHEFRKKVHVILPRKRNWRNFNKWQDEQHERLWVPATEAARTQGLASWARREALKVWFNRIAFFLFLVLS